MTIDTAGGEPGGHVDRLAAVSDPRLVSLDVESVLEDTLEGVREEMSVDTVAVLLLDPSGQFLVATASRGVEQEVRQGVRIPVGRGFAGRIAAEQRALAIEDLDHATVLNPLLRSRGIRSLLGVPLLAAGSLVGVMHVGTLSKRRFGEDDAAHLQVIADRIALAVQTRASREERAAAAALQRSLWPAALPSVPGLELAARYVPGGHGQMGGDWYDVLVMPSGTIWIVIGDVVGRGMPAAMAMGRLRGAVRAYALELTDPAELLRRLDRHVRHFDPDVMATVLCGALDPSCSQLRLSSAGHLPPIVSQGADLPSALCELPIDPPLGVDASRPRRSCTVEVTPGAGFCFYTDGLVERRGVPLDDGLERLRQTVTAGSAESVCAAIMSAMIGDTTAEDDVAILLMRRLGPAELGPLDMRMPAVPASLHPLRAALRRWLTEAGVGWEDVTDILLATGEAVANAVEHAYGPRGGTVHLHVAREGGEVVATIVDAGQWRSPRGKHRGRGLALLDGAADAVHIERSHSGTRVVLRKTVRGWAR